MGSIKIDSCHLLIAITIVVAVIIIILMAPNSALGRRKDPDHHEPGSADAAGGNAMAQGARSGASRVGAPIQATRAKRGMIARPPQTAAPQAYMPPLQRSNTSREFREWVYEADPAAVYEAEALDVVGGGREFREGFEAVNPVLRRDWQTGPDADTIVEAEALDVVGGGDGTAPTCSRRGCSAASAEMQDVAFGPPDPDWDRLAAKADAEGISLAQGGGGPSGPGAYVRGTPFTIPGYRPGGVTASRDDFKPRRSGFTPLPGGHNPQAVFASYSDGDGPWPDSETGGSPAPWDRAIVPRGTPHGVKYPGAIEADSRDVDTPGAWFQGHRDRNISQNKIIEGNPFDLSRIASPQAAGSCADDEAHEIADLDEANVNQVRSRNDATRVEAGIFNRRRWLDPYLREELDQEELEWGPWWGKHEL